MSELLKYLASPVWWITVVVFGIIINLASDYLKPLIDRNISKVWHSYRIKVNKKSERRNREVQELVNNHHKQIMKRIFALSLRVHGATTFVLGIVVMFLVDKFKPNELFSTIILLGLGAMILFAGSSNISNAHKIETIINEARGIEEENSEIEQIRNANKKN